MAGQQIRRHVGKQVACILHEEGPTVPINVKPVQDNVIGDVLVLCELFSGENHLISLQVRGHVEFKPMCHSPSKRERTEMGRVMMNVM